jgi:hypothetical protein
MRVRFEKNYSVELCRAHPDEIFVFGDNLAKKGKAKGAGQAEIRDEPNAFGIPTKVAPATTEDAYFSDKDDEMKKVRAALVELYKLGRVKRLVFPLDGIGTGRAKTAEKSPQIWAYLNKILEEHFGVENGKPMRMASPTPSP